MPQEIIEIKNKKLVIDLEQCEVVRLFDNNKILLCIGEFNCVDIGCRNSEQATDLLNKIKVELRDSLETTFCKNKV